MLPQEGLPEEDPAGGRLLSRAQALLHIIEQDFVYWVMVRPQPPWGPPLVDLPIGWLGIGQICGGS